MFRKDEIKNYPFVNLSHCIVVKLQNNNRRRAADSIDNTARLIRRMSVLKFNDYISKMVSGCLKTFSQKNKQQKPCSILRAEVFVTIAIRLVKLQNFDNIASGAFGVQENQA